MSNDDCIGMIPSTAVALGYRKPPPIGTIPHEFKNSVKKFLDPYRDPHRNQIPNNLLLMRHFAPQKMSSKFGDNFLSYPVDRDTNAEIIIIIIIIIA